MSASQSTCGIASPGSPASGRLTFSSPNVATRRRGEAVGTAASSGQPLRDLLQRRRFHVASLFGLTHKPCRSRLDLLTNACRFPTIGTDQERTSRSPDQNSDFEERLRARSMRTRADLMTLRNPAVHWADRKKAQKGRGPSVPSEARSSQKGGKRVCLGRVGKDRSSGRKQAFFWPKASIPLSARKEFQGWRSRLPETAAPHRVDPPL
jgi:hypothetical protein